ncbi:MAG: hypothetical protein QG621_288, partial [Patescibacteria group bacterium]|nr:hypothetical protein [Patescibacteria group bacterium]
YLQLRDSGEKIEIGSAESGEFRLVQCLFSPQNFPSAKYEPVVQTYERIFAVIQTQSLLERSAAERGSHREITHTVEKLLHNLQKGNMRHHVTFISKNNRVLMEIL